MDSISKTLASLVKLPPPLRISPDFNFFASALPKIFGGGGAGHSLAVGLLVCEDYFN